MNSLERFPRNNRPVRGSKKKRPAEDQKKPAERTVPDFLAEKSPTTFRIGLANINNFNKWFYNFKDDILCRELI